MVMSNTLRAIEEGLKTCEIGQDGMLVILCLLKTPAQEQSMLNYMLKMEEPETEEQLLTAALTIAGKIVKRRPDTSKRDKLLKELNSRGMSNRAILRILEPMDGKTQEQKELIAGQIMKKMRIA